jgi:hypothetical protein
MDCVVKTAINSGNIANTSTHSLRSSITNGLSGS